MNEYYYLTAYRIRDNQLVFLKIYHKTHDLIINLLIDYDFEIKKYEEDLFNKLERKSNKTQKTDYMVLTIDPSITEERIINQLKKTYESKTT